jgi:endoglucanase
MDEIGLIVTYVEEDGFLRIDAVGGVRPQTTAFRQIRFASGVMGVVGYETGKVKSFADLTMARLFVDIGASTREEALAKVAIGDIAHFTSEYIDMGKRACSKAMDNRAGCAVLVEMLKGLDHPAMDVVGVFTVQEEVGLRGAKTAAWSVNPDVGVALDVTVAADYPGAATASMKLGAGPCVKIKDASVVCTPSVVAWLEGAAAASGVKWQWEVLTAGGTDTAAIQLTGAGIPAGCISIAERYVHSQGEVVEITDLEDAVRLMIQAAQTGYVS